jgi:hypothetical protein
MAVGDRTRRPLPAVLLSLALLLGLCAVVPASSVIGDRRPVSAPATTTVVSTAVAHTVDHAVTRAAEAGLQSLASWQRHIGGPAPLAAAALLAALVGCSLRRWWSAGRGSEAGPAAGGRFVRDSRAPPGGSLPSA